MKKINYKPSNLDAFCPRIVIKFDDQMEVPFIDNLETKSNSKFFTGIWKNIVKEFPGIQIKKKFRSASEAQIKKLIIKAQKLDKTYSPTKLNNYFTIECKADTKVKKLLKRLNRTNLFEVVYEEGKPTPPPAVNDADDPRSVNQDYLNAAPEGIDARYAWGFSGGDGAGIDFIDIEQGWTLNHEDLIAHGISLISGVNNSFFGHGTAVLGEVVGFDNTLGGIGIAPKCNARVISQWRTSSNYDTEDSILSALLNLNFGDVLLLEAQASVSGLGFVPVEVDQAVFDIIRLGSALGIIIIEASGNGSNDLDMYSDSVLGNIFRKGSPDFRDSGAIVIGAASSDTSHFRMSFSNFGSRVDCFAWGQNIDTSGGSFAGTSTNAYTTFFDGTSGASGIIAGAAIVIQGIMESTHGFRLSPKQMRDILSNTLNGTPSDDPINDKIGVMPNLRRIIDNDLNITPDLYLRDFVGDDGDSHLGAVSASPDIIVKNSIVPNPTAAFGPASGFQNSPSLSDTVIKGQDNFIYLRILNRGKSDATNVNGDVYWSPAATLVTPDLWNFIGSVNVPNVPTMNVLTVSDEIIWPDSNIPNAGHYCFVGILGNNQDPPPPLTDLQNWDNFISFIRKNNNVTWKNFNVVDIIPPSSSRIRGFVPLPFLLTGAHDKSRLFGLKIISGLPGDAKIFMEVPLNLAKAFYPNVDEIKIDKKRETAFVPIRNSNKYKFDEIILPKGLRAKCNLYIKIPPKKREHDYEIAISQEYEDFEVGRITWRLSGKNYKNE